MNESYLKFIEEPKYHVIVCFGEEKSEPLYTKGQALKKLFDLEKSGKILPVDFSKMKDEIFQEDDLTWEEEHDHVNTMRIDLIMLPPFGFPFGSGFDESPFGFGSMFANPFAMFGSNPFRMLGELEMISDILERIMEKNFTEEPAFVPCRLCSKKHGKITTKQHCTLPLYSKEEAMKALQAIVKRGSISKEEASKVEQQIIEYFTETAE